MENTKLFSKFKKIGAIALMIFLLGWLVANIILSAGITGIEGLKALHKEEMRAEEAIAKHKLNIEDLERKLAMETEGLGVERQLRADAVTARNDLINSTNVAQNGLVELTKPIEFPEPIQITEVPKANVAYAESPVMQTISGDFAKMTKKPATAEYLVIHHTASNSTFDSVNGSHQRRGFPKSELGYYVGYHYFIGKDGTVRQARNDYEIGSHSSGSGMNSKAIGIALVGNFNNESPSPAQLQAARTLTQGLQFKYDIPSLNVIGHRDAGQTACPGNNLSPEMLVSNN